MKFGRLAALIFATALCGAALGCACAKPAPAAPEQVKPKVVEVESQPKAGAAPAEVQPGTAKAPAAETAPDDAPAPPPLGKGGTRVG